MQRPKPQGQASSADEEALVPPPGPVWLLWLLFSRILAEGPRGGQSMQLPSSPSAPRRPQGASHRSRPRGVTAWQRSQAALWFCEERRRDRRTVRERPCRADALLGPLCTNRSEDSSPSAQRPLPAMAHGGQAAPDTPGGGGAPEKEPVCLPRRTRHFLGPGLVTTGVTGCSRVTRRPSGRWHADQHDSASHEQLTE